MVAILKQWVLVIDLPFKVRELQKQGFDHFEGDFKGDSRRLELRAWRKSSTIQNRTLNCLECTGKFANTQALAVHRKLVHGH